MPEAPLACLWPWLAAGGGVVTSQASARAVGASGAYGPTRPPSCGSTTPCLASHSKVRRASRRRRWERRLRLLTWTAPACLPVVPDAGDAGTASARVTTTDHQGNVVSFLTVGGTTTQHRGGQGAWGHMHSRSEGGGDHACLLSGTRAWLTCSSCWWCGVVWCWCAADDRSGVQAAQDRHEQGRRGGGGRGQQEEQQEQQETRARLHLLVPRGGAALPPVVVAGPLVRLVLDGPPGPLSQLQGVVASAQPAAMAVELELSQPAT